MTKVLLFTLTSTIGLHDAGDMITASYLLGIPHQQAILSIVCLANCG
ncbi:MAG: hypothetical protein V2A53_01400 [bacterium]